MQVSYQWLKEYIEPGIDARQLAELMTLSGIEVSTVEPFGPSLPGIVAGKVIALEKHPGKSGLTLVKSDIGGTVLEIVCGADNMQVGDMVAVATPGSELPGQRLIDKALIYGITSHGMLCSAQELGLDLGSENEILILDESVASGEAVDKVLGFDDQILYLELTPNRSDCLGLLGVAYEVAALTGKAVKVPPHMPAEAAGSINKAVKITVEDRKLCPRYTARVVQNIKIGRSPLWLQLRLLKSGVRPINNVVDITNYVMLEFGQPLHAFDLRLLRGETIIVRRAKNGEELVTLDGNKRTLDPEVLVIADAVGPVGLAGVMGGENSEISDGTDTVLIEAAAFDAINIRRTSRRYNLPSEASQRFEKGINHETVLQAQNRAALMMGELVGGKVLSGAIDLNFSEAEPCRITVDPNRINLVLGTDISREEVVNFLKRLGFSVSDPGTGPLDLVVPLRRPDVIIEEDIIEEIARLYGYDRIPTTLPRGELLDNRKPLEQRLINTIIEILVSSGFFECVTYSFINPDNLARLRIPDNDPIMKTIPVRNPFSEEQAIMRTTIIPGLLKIIQYNSNFRELNQMLFEIGTIYEAETLPLEKLPVEKKKLALAVTGIVPDPNWVIPSSEADFYTIKGTLEKIVSRLKVEGLNFVTRVAPYSHPTRSAAILLHEEEIGLLCQLHPEIASAWDLVHPVTICEIDLALLIERANPVPRIAPLPRYPAAKRDIALVIPREISAQQLEKVMQEAGGELVNSIELFDLYEGKQIPEGKRSLAYAITFRSDQGTLTDAAVNQAMQKIEKAVFSLGAVLRSH